MENIETEQKIKRTLTIWCSECDRTFDLTNDEQAQEWYYGHDCGES